MREPVENLCINHASILVEHNANKIFTFKPMIEKIQCEKNCCVFDTIAEISIKSFNEALIKKYFNKKYAKEIYLCIPHFFQKMKNETINTFTITVLDEKKPCHNPICDYIESTCKLSIIKEEL